MNIFDKLNENQKEAVLHTEGPLLILAGAGSGKTRVITYRIAYMIQEKHIPHYNIMAVTFTNKAVEEMKTRVINMIGPAGNSVFIKTFHSSSVFILRKYGGRIGIPSSFSIYDRSDQESIVKEILIDMRLDPKKIRPLSIVERISEIKDKPEFFSGNIDLLMPKNYPFNFQEIYRKYQSRLKTLCALDFNDLLIETVGLLKNHPDVLSELQNRWRYFMIDEYQDTNHAQYLLCRYLSQKTRNICVVGDDDQSIYTWRGADIRNILDFEKDYSDAKVITLEENYRSTSPILDAASFVIKHNEMRKDKNLKAVRGEGELAVWCRANNEYGEAEFVVNSIQSFKNREGMKNRDFAIFYRTNAQSRVFEDILRRENISYRVIGGLRFYDRKEIKDIIAYLKVIANPNDAVSLFRIINTPSRGIGNAAVEAVREAASSGNISEWNVIAGGFEIKGKRHRGIEEFKNIMSGCIETSKNIPEGTGLSEFIKEVIKITGYKDQLEVEDSTESRARVENIEEFVNSVYDYEAAFPEANLAQFLQDISLLTSEEDPQAEEAPVKDYVTLMTVHNAKGLEFRVVYLTGMEDGIFPHFNSIDTQAGIEEERRLCYVGITRAMDRIFLTSAEIRRRWGKIDFRTPSRFIYEIPGELIDLVQHDSAGVVSSFSFQERHHQRFSVSEDVEIEEEFNHKQDNIILKQPPSIEKGSKFRISDRALHPKYGIGRILKIAGKGDNIKLTISFGSGRSKTFLEKYTPLEKVN
ncbi:MAG: UvrD-helicase domain-containing protein [Spirochaetes bacterium]|nr:UvrD-helicase domain-containing protein [Spirochaetota bacterium]